MPSNDGGDSYDGGGGWFVVIGVIMVVGSGGCDGEVG